MSVVRVVVNGEARLLAAAITIAELVEREAGSTKGVAVALNATLVPRSRWDGVSVADGDHIELVRAVQGG